MLEKNNPKIQKLTMQKNDLEKFEIKTDLNSSKIELEQLIFIKIKTKICFRFNIAKNKNMK